MANHFVFLGDSITDADRFWIEDHLNLGNGYVYEIWKQLQTISPDICITNKGYSSLSASALLERLKKGSIEIPACTHIILLIGINDVGKAVNTGVSLTSQEFEKTYLALLLILKEKGSLFCFSPFLFPEPAEYQNWLPVLSEAEQIMKDTAGSLHLPFSSLQDFFTEQLKEQTVSDLSLDGIHLTRKGHALLAGKILSVLL